MIVSERPSFLPPLEHPSPTPGTRRAPGPLAACLLPSAHFAPTTLTSWLSWTQPGLPASGPLHVLFPLPVGLTPSFPGQPPFHLRALV